MDFIAGIDGGGTKTTLLCQDLTGRTLGTEVFGPLNINGTEQAALEELLHALAGTLRRKGRCLALCIGAAGVSNPRFGQMAAKAMDEAGVGRWRLAGDHEIALAGGLDDGPGCALIAGTGSICVGSDGAGNTVRAGGWGHLIGDEGSGYALGRDALRAVTRFWDGWGGATALTQLLDSQLGLRDRQSVVSYVYDGDKRRLAALAPLVERAAADGDEKARDIIEDNAWSLAKLAQGVAERLGIGRGEIVMLGGLLESETLLRRRTVEMLAGLLPEWTCIPPKRSAAEGALLLARRLLDESDG